MAGDGRDGATTELAEFILLILNCCGTAPDPAEPRLRERPGRDPGEIIIWGRWGSQLVSYKKQSYTLYSTVNII